MLDRSRRAVNLGCAVEILRTHAMSMSCCERPAVVDLDDALIAAFDAVRAASRGTADHARGSALATESAERLVRIVCVAETRLDAILLYPHDARWAELARTAQRLGLESDELVDAVLWWRAFASGRVEAERGTR